MTHLTSFRTLTDPDEIAEEAVDARTEMERLFFAHEGRPAHKWRRYLEVYDRHFAPLRAAAAEAGRPLRMLEIGVANGGSLDLWRAYFGPEAVLFGVDLDPACAAFDGLSAQVRIGSQADPAFLARVVAEMGGLDLVLDDGSHQAAHQSASFRALFPLLNEGGLYMVEDLHTSYWDGWGGGVKRKGTFIELLKELMDEMHGWYAPMKTSLSGMRLDEAAFALHLYDSVAAIEKRRVAAPYSVFKR